MLALWDECVRCLQDELPAQQFNTWIRPLRASETDSGLVVSAPNRFVKDWVKDKPPYIQYKYADPNDKLIILRDPDEQLIENIFEKSLVLRKTHNDNEIDTIFIQLIPSEKKKRKSESSNAPDNSGMKSTPNKRKFKF